VGLANLGTESETCVGSLFHLVGVSISFEKNFYRLLFTPPASLVRRISPSNTGGNNNKKKNQGGRSNNYSGPNRKRKPDNTVVAIQCPAKDNSKRTSGGFKDLLKEKCSWHLDGNHTTEQCYQLR
jgi:hypothetical protein